MRIFSSNNAVTAMYLTAAILTALCLSCKDSEKYIVAEVDGQIITTDEFQNELKIYPFDKNSTENISAASKFLEIKKELLNSMIRGKILLAQARKEGVRATDGELAVEISKIREDYPDNTFNQYLKDKGISYPFWENKVRDDITVRKLTDLVTKNIKAVQESEIADYYEKNKPEFTVPDEIHAFQIVVKTEEEAYKIYNELKKGSKFEDLAKTYSIMPEGKNGGDLGYFSKGSMPAVFGDVLFKLGQGSISRVVASEYGYHIFKVADKKASKILPLSSVRDKIVQELIRNKKDDLFSEWFKEKIAKSKIKRNNVLLATLR